MSLLPKKCLTLLDKILHTKFKPPRMKTVPAKEGGIVENPLASRPTNQPTDQPIEPLVAAKKNSTMAKHYIHLFFTFLILSVWRHFMSIAIKTHWDVVQPSLRGGREQERIHHWQRATYTRMTSLYVRCLTRDVLQQHRD